MAYASNNFAQLKLDAVAKGWDVRQTETGTRITRTITVNQYKTKVVGLFIDDRGWGWDIDPDLDPSIVKGVHSVDVMRSILDLPKQIDQACWIALKEFACKHGRCWKYRLCLLWEQGVDVGCELQTVRNVLGPSGVRKLRLDVELG